MKISSVGYGSDTKTSFPDMNDSIASSCLSFNLPLNVFLTQVQQQPPSFTFYIADSITPTLRQELCLPPLEQSSTVSLPDSSSHPS